MIKNIFLTLFIAFFSISSIAQEIIEIDIDQSHLQWVGSKLTSSHEGDIKLKSGEVKIKDGKLFGGMFVIDMTTIKTTDIEDEKYRLKLDNHLKNEDFFHVDKYPYSTLKIINVKNIKKEYYKITADLTIKGITRPIIFEAYVKIDDEFQAKSDIIFDRSKWGIKYKSKTFFDDLGDYMILDEIQLKLSLVSVSK
tara:strand:+ start:439 stop:1023 length:585 start_codon:yes stop_codon:yes gene_type:complete